MFPTRRFPAKMLAYQEAVENFMHNGRFIMVDGITGSGKSTVLQAVQSWAMDCGHRTFRLSEWKEARPPTFEEVSDFDVYFTSEPSRTWVGSAIRNELSREDTPYGGMELAHAFALDRQIMYRRLLIPALQAGKTIVQDRGVSSSLVYQPVMNDSVPLETVMALPGNAQALEWAPNALVLTQLSAEVAFERIHSRNDDSKGVFAQLPFLKQQAERYASPWLRNIFESRGTTVHTLDTSGALADTTTLATKLIDRILTTC